MKNNNLVFKFFSQKSFDIKSSKPLKIWLYFNMEDWMFTNPQGNNLKYSKLLLTMVQRNCIVDRST